MTEAQKLKPIELQINQTKRPISNGAEKWLGVPIPCLDHGFVYLVDYLGTDQSIEQAARVSYGSGTRRLSETEGLIRYLRRHDHTTPFEMVEMKFHAKMPIFVARQWVRHRTASINEYSGRYSILDKEFYVPEPDILAEQSTSNRQGRGEVVPEQYAQKIRELIVGDADRQYEHYENLLNDDGNGKPVNPEEPMLARELARMGLGLNFYTQWYWKIDLHNFMHFSRLRMDKHAQYEIRVYADAMAQIAKDAFPIAWKAFEDYELNAKKFTGPELQVLQALLSDGNIFSPRQILEIAKLANLTSLTNKREQDEMIAKFKSLGIVEIPD